MFQTLRRTELNQSGQPDERRSGADAIADRETTTTPVVVNASLAPQLSRRASESSGGGRRVSASLRAYRVRDADHNDSRSSSSSSSGGDGDAMRDAVWR